MLCDKIIIDFIIKLLKFKNLAIKKNYNAILIIVNRFTTYF